MTGAVPVAALGLAAALTPGVSIPALAESQSTPLQAVKVDAPPEKPRAAAQAKPKPVASQARHASGAQRLPPIDVGGARRSARVLPTTRAPVGAAAPSVQGPPGDRPLFPATALGRGPTDVVGYFAGRTSTATKTNTPIIDIPQSITILTKQQLQDRNSIDLNRALMFVPGVTVAQGEGNRDQITIRGQDTSADFYTDGIRDDAQYFRDLYNIEAVEVLKGPNALIFGRGGGGGVVNRVTKKADGERLRSMMVSSGSFARKRLTVDVGDAINDTLAVRLNGLYEQSYGYRDFFKLERYGVNPTMTWRPLEKTFVTLSYEHFRDRRTADRGIPSVGGFVFGGSSIYPGYPSPAPIDAFFGVGNPSVEAVNYAKVDLNRAALAFDHTTEFGLNIRNQTVYADYEKRYQNTFPDQGLGFVTTQLNPVARAVTPVGVVRLDGYVSSNPRQNIFNQTDLVYKWQMTPDIRHTVMFGAEVGNQKTDDNRNLSCFNLSCATRRVTTPFWTPTALFPVVFANPNRRRHTDLDLAAGYVQDQIEVTRYIDVIAGVRFDRFDLKFTGFDPGPTDFRGQLRRVDNVWSPRFGLVFKPIDILSFYGSYSRSFLPVAGDQFNVLFPTVANLAPQSFENVEVGFKAQLLPSLLLTGALYQLNRSNQQLTVDATTAILANTRTQGGELGLVGNVTDRWEVSLGYGYQDARVVSTDRRPTVRTPFFTDVGKTNPSVPRNTFSFWNKYDISSFFDAGPGVLGVGAGVVYNSKFYPAIDNFVVVPGYARVDGALFVKLSENVSGQLNVENLAGARYYVFAHNNNNITPGAPRSAYITLNARF
ncbi:MAG: TonB-dependent siderophore receptor [Methylocystis sp.]|nr:TonB-dependent siderophore receptor [Methylocystis sp.]